MTKEGMYRSTMVLEYEAKIMTNPTLAPQEMVTKIIILFIGYLPHVRHGSATVRL